MSVTSADLRQGIAQNFALGLFPVVKEAASNLDVSQLSSLLCFLYWSYLLD